jgi:hypothetical protein
MKITQNLAEYIIKQISDDMKDLKFGSVGFMLTAHENDLVDISKTISIKDKKFINKLMNENEDECHEK